MADAIPGSFHETELAWEVDEFGVASTIRVEVQFPGAVGGDKDAFTMGEDGLFSHGYLKTINLRVLQATRRYYNHLEGLFILVNVSPLAIHGENFNDDIPKG